METRKKNKKGYVFALVAVMLLPCLSLMQAQAASKIDLDQECSLTVSVEVGSSENYLEDFNQMTIPVSLYKVADVDVTGQRYTPEEAFKEMDFDTVNKKTSSVTADEWQSLAEQADEILKVSSIEPAGTTEVQKPESGGSASGTIEGLTPGMYLVAPEASYNTDYSIQYTFAPYLTALPSSDYAQEGVGSDEWVYDRVIGLKPDAQPQYGKLNIIKTLQNYNETLGQTTFVFHITGVDQDGVTRYDEVESLTYTSAGSSTIVLEEIPAGLTMTVTEIYSGASYTIDGSDQETAVVWSDAAVEAGAAQEASVSFRNHYDGGNRSGYGVTNHFESDGEGGWTWQNPTTPAGE